MCIRDSFCIVRFGNNLLVVGSVASAAVLLVARLVFGVESIASWGHDGGLRHWVALPRSRRRALCSRHPRAPSPASIRTSPRLHPSMAQAARFPSMARRAARWGPSAATEPASRRRRPKRDAEGHRAHLASTPTPARSVSLALARWVRAKMDPQTATAPLGTAARSTQGPRASSAARVWSLAVAPYPFAPPERAWRAATP